MDKIFSKLNMEMLLDYISDGIQIIDNKGYILYYNRAAAQLDDINKEEALGKHILEVYPSLSTETSTLIRAIHTGTPTLNIQQAFLNYKGKKIVTINSSFPIYSKDKIIGAIEISRNITNVKELSEKVMDLQQRLLYKNSRSRGNKVADCARYSFFDIIGQNKVMLKTKGMAMRAAQTSSPVLIYGETGTGKELLVHAIHGASSRRDKPLIAQNCAALPATLLEAILFGTVKGSFTGADDRAGLFELADGGTLFLDEINSMEPDLQVKLLRVLQDGFIRRVGDIVTRRVDVRIIATSNVEPLTAVEAKRLRRDLYYRLNVVNLRVPELRERVEDIPLLTEHFIRKYNSILNKNVISISNEVLEIFKSYEWPGNVRELEHVIEGAMNLMDGTVITLQNLPSYLINYGKGLDEYRRGINMLPLRNALEQLEKQMISNALREWNWNVSHAADSLEIPRQTLQYKIKKYKLKRE
jgi:arginine utilization regulatory protein